MVREVVFVKQNKEKWAKFEHNTYNNAEELADQFIELTDDLAYARTFYPGSKTEKYLNQLTSGYYVAIYKNKKEKSGRFVNFWRYELPLTVRSAHRELLFAFLFFVVTAVIGAFSAAKDDTFVRLILGDGYVNSTLTNIEKGDPMAVYKQADQLSMFFQITTNNIMVSYRAFVAGIFGTIGTLVMLFYNGVMLGSFQFFFYQKGLLLSSALSIWLHGTLEISSIVIAGGAGLVLGNSLLFPGTYSRLVSFKQGAKKGIKIALGISPLFVVAGFIESFLTRYTQMPIWLSGGIILLSAAFIIWYFVIYPIQLERTLNHDEQ